jgi:hypothetical protein
VPVPEAMDPSFESLRLTRLVASSTVLDALLNETDFRLSPDEALTMADVELVQARVGAKATISVAERVAAIIEADFGWSGAWMPEHELRVRLAQCCEWAPLLKPGVNQGMIAGVPAKVWLSGSGTEKALVFCPTAFVADLSERLSGRVSGGVS